MINNTLFFLRHFPTFIKFWITNARYRLYGFRRFKYTLYFEEKENQGGTWVTTGFKKEKDIIILADYMDEKKLKSIPPPLPPEYEIDDKTLEEYRHEQLPFVLLRDLHPEPFRACTHLTRKEII